MRRGMRIIFENAGYTVSEAGTVGEAVQAVATAMPDVILLDITLPDGDGLSLIPAIAPRTPARPVIVALTGHDEAAIVQRCRDMGCHEVLLKPVPARDLIRAVGALLG